MLQDRVSKSGHQSHALKSEKDVLSSLSHTDGSFGWVYRVFEKFLESELAWSTALDKVLTNAGYDVAVDQKRKSWALSWLLQ